MTRSTLLVWLCLASVLPAPADVAASDFWDEVREPGRGRQEAELARARLALRAHRYPDALEAADEAVAALPEASEGHVVRGLALGELRRYDEAREAFERALALDPRALDPPAEGARAAELVALGGGPDLAVAILDRVLGHMGPGPRRRTLYALQGDLLLALGPDRLGDATAAYREALRGESPGDPRARLGLALALDRAGDHAAAQELLATLAEDAEGLERLVRRAAIPPPELAARLALLRQAAGDREGAGEAWREAAAGGPWSAHAQASLRALTARAGPR